MKAALVGACIALGLLVSGLAARADDDVEMRRDIPFADHDGTKLLGDFYLPKGASKAPVVIAIHGGGWAHRSQRTYQYWGPYLAKHHYAVFEITYRVGPAGMFPRSVYDVKSAIQFVRAHAAEYGLDPDRIGLMGDSSGGHLAALVGLAADDFRDDATEPDRNVSAKVKVAISFYGIYDMAEQWRSDQLLRPADQITEKYLGAPPYKNRKVYFESSPISYATTGRTATRFLIINGSEDDIVDPRQAKNFQIALNEAGIYSRRIVVPGAGHFWAEEPFEHDPLAVAAQISSRILRFLETSL
jgi:acetyl esterase/lipase